MEMCSTDEEYGYYTNKQKILAEGGDFTTSAEISQMFGEVKQYSHLIIVDGRCVGYGCLTKIMAN